HSIHDHLRAPYTRATVLSYLSPLATFWSSFFFSSRRRHTRSKRDWSSDVCSSDLCPGPASTGHLEPVLRADAAGGQGAGDDGAGPGDGEGAVHPQSHPVLGSGLRGGRGDLVEAGAQLLHARP